jgi:NAD(P)-dependent dehydrogenase (short-subunit alcohol dehydrogenase family)
MRFQCPSDILSQPFNGRTYLITGVSKGLGLTLTKKLLPLGATVLGISRNKPMLDHPNFRWYAIDLSDPQAIYDWCHSDAISNTSLDGLVNNAAVIPQSRKENHHGWELQWSVNYVAPTLLSALLEPRLQHGRIVHVSSTAHHRVFERNAAIHFSDVHCEHRPYDKWVAYAQSKLALHLHMNRWIQVFPNIPMVCVHPGWVDTTLSPSRVPSWLTPLVKPILRHKGLCSLNEGIQPILYTLLFPKIEQYSGQIFNQYSFYEGLSEPKMGWMPISPNPIANDAVVAEQLWEMTRRMTVSWLDD